MKKIFGIFALIFISIGVISVNVRAQSNPVIYCEEKEALSKDEYIIKVSIKNNSGIMGYKVIGKYDSRKMKIESIACGKTFDNGMFQENIMEKQNQFLVLWTGIADVRKNDVLFYLRVKVLDKESEKHKIQLSYSEEDTFNEKWENVKISCQDIVIDLDENVPDAPSETVVIFEDEEVKEFVENVVCDIPADKIVNIIDKAVQENDMKSPEEIDEISEADKKQILESVYKQLQKNGIDLENIKKEKEEKQIFTIQKLYKSAKEEQKKIESGQEIKIEKNPRILVERYL